MKKHFPESDPNDTYSWNGWSSAHVFAEVIKQCGDQLTRENLMQVVTHLTGVAAPAFLPGVTIELSPTDYRPIRTMQFERFDGNSWVLFGGLVE